MPKKQEITIRDRIVDLRRVKASSLKPSPANWRTHPKAQQDAMRGVLSEIGYAGALLARKCEDGTLELIDGHLRADLTPDMEVPVLVLDVDEREARYLLATHDPLAAMAESNSEALAALLADVSSGNAAVQAMLAGIYQMPVKNQNNAGDDTMPALPDEPVTKPGDVWMLGDHRLICTDCNYVQCPKDASACVFDPEWDSPPDIALPKNVLAFTDGARARDVIDKLGSPAWVFAWDCVTSWYTPNRPLRRMKLCFWYGDISDYNPDGAHYGDPGQAHEVSNTRGSYHYEPDARGKHLSDVFQKQITVEHSDGLHAHSKPLDWVRMLIGNCTFGDVYDPCAGSGVSLIAAEQLGRKCLAVEINPAYCDVIVKRWENLTGNKATLEKT